MVCTTCSCGGGVNSKAMNLSDENLDEFIKIYKKEFRRKISRQEAMQLAEDFLRLYEMLASQRPKEALRSEKSDAA